MYVRTKEVSLLRKNLLSFKKLMWLQLTVDRREELNPGEHKTHAE